MSLDGLRAWIGEVERKLGKRTRVFLALTVIAIGIAGASLYLAIEARNDSVSESDVRLLQEKLETRIDEVAAGSATTTPTVPPVETEPEPAPAPAPEELKPKSENGAQGQSPQSSSGGAQDKSAKVLEFLERAKKQSAEAEAEQNGK
jgi:hypothetical protein